MLIAAIISEYNPFHNGHKYQIEQTRKNGATHIVSIMSGNFTQRGTPSIISKHQKAEIALHNGCDLVVELPVAYSISSAEKFAFGATFLADSLGCIDFLSFGCENDNIKLLTQAAQIAKSDKVLNLTKNYLKDEGISFASARQKAIEHIYTTTIASLFSQPNNILAIEYINSLSLLHSNIKPLPILRKSINHDSNFTSNKFASASLLRELILKNDMKIKNFIPKSCYNILINNIAMGLGPADILNCERAFLAKLRSMSSKDFLNIVDVTEGLENKIYKAIKSSNSLAEIYTKVKSKRYTQLRIQRIILSAFLEINKDILKDPPPYIKILGFNKRGEEVLKLAKKQAKIPIITKASEINNLKGNSTATKFFETEKHAYDLYNLMLPKIQKCGFEMTGKIIKL